MHSNDSISFDLGLKFEIRDEITNLQVEDLDTLATESSLDINQATKLLKCSENVLILRQYNQFNETFCRFPTCSKVEQNGRQLYLCLEHNEKLRIVINNYCKNYNLNAITFEENSRRVNSESIIKLIAILDTAYRKQNQSTNMSRLRYWKEVLLNSRNILLITVSLISRERSQQYTIETFVSYLLKKLIEVPEDRRSHFNNLSLLLREGTELILHAYGVVYEWLQFPYSTEDLNPGRYLGLGVGGITGGFIVKAMSSSLLNFSEVMFGFNNVAQTTEKVCFLFGAVLGVAAGSYLGSKAYWVYDKNIIEKDLEKVKKEYTTFAEEVQNSNSLISTRQQTILFVCARKDGIPNPESLEIVTIT